MKHELKIRIVLLCLSAMATPAATTAAQAETIFLKCPPMDMLSVDLTKHTVNNVPANITPVAIDWQNRNQYGETHYHIDRTAGTLRISGTYFRAEGNLPIPQSVTSCAIAKAPSTKF